MFCVAGINNPFGEVDVATGTPVDLRFPGQWYSSESALHQNWMRDYDPGTGRHLQPDPLGLIDGPSVYGYARQSPYRYTDPRGEFTLGDAYRGLVKRRANGSEWYDLTNDMLFDMWLELERAQGLSWIEEIPRCACDISDIDFDVWNELSEVMQKFHPGGVWETRTKRPTRGSHGGQCIYDEAGKLMLDIPAAGTADFFAPVGLGVSGHYAHDVQPFELAEKLGRLQEYYEVRPVR